MVNQRIIYLIVLTVIACGNCGSPPEPKPPEPKNLDRAMALALLRGYLDDRGTIDAKPVSEGLLCLPGEFNRPFDPEIDDDRRLVDWLQSNKLMNASDYGRFMNLPEERRQELFCGVRRFFADINQMYYAKQTLTETGRQASVKWKKASIAASERGYITARWLVPVAQETATEVTGIVGGASEKGEAEVQYLQGWVPLEIGPNMKIEPHTYEGWQGRVERSDGVVALQKPGRVMKQAFLRLYDDGWRVERIVP